MRIDVFLILGIFVCSSAFSGEVVDLKEFRKQKLLRDSQSKLVDEDNVPYDPPSMYGRRPRKGGNQKLYEQAYQFVRKPILEGGMGMSDKTAHEWASTAAAHESPFAFNEWRKRYWAALEFALKRGDLTPLAGGWAWEKADESTSKEIDDIIAKHYGWSRSFYKFGEKFRKQFQLLETPDLAIEKNDRPPGQVIDLRPASVPVPKAEVKPELKPEAATVAPNATQGADCVRSMMMTFFDPFGLFNR